MCVSCMNVIPTIDMVIFTWQEIEFLLNFLTKANSKPIGNVGDCLIDSLGDHLLGCYRMCSGSFKKNHNYGKHIMHGLTIKTGCWPICMHLYE